MLIAVIIEFFIHPFSPSHWVEEEAGLAQIKMTILINSYLVVILSSDRIN
jgi:hypothetical protein